MIPLDGLDLSGLAQFKASDLLAAAPGGAPCCTPMRVALSLIDLDPAQPRRHLDEGSLRALAASLETHGVLEPVSLRTHPGVGGRFIVNRGERRVRAALLAGWVEVPAFLDERIDPYAQAVENLHREDMSPFDLATFIETREKEGHSRAEIGRRLNKSRSFITEAASLIGAPSELRAAFDAGRLGADARALYRLALALKKEPARAAALLVGDAIITRSRLDHLMEAPSDGAAGQGALSSIAPSSPIRPASGGRTVLVVEHSGRRGSLRLKAHDNDAAEVRFGDGTRDLVKLKDLRLVCWATEE